MALTYTPAFEAGKKFENFKLPTVDGKSFDSAEVNAAVLVVMFICNHCPYVKAIEDRMLRLARQMEEKKSVQFVAVCSNDPSDYPEDDPAQLYKTWKEKNYPFPYLIDADQRLARSFDAVCTPDLFVLDRERRLRYRGRWDDSWKDENKVQRQDLKLAIEAVLADATLNFTPVPSMGCSIKWKEQSL